MEENNYGQRSISSLKDEQQVRQRPAVIFGTNDEYGCAHGIYEIIANAMDEAREGYGNQIRVSIYKNGEVEVSDDGRGVPMGWNPEEQKYNWELVFCTLYASGKYDADNYSESLGLNGLGATAMQYASEFMDVYSTRDGVTSHMRFEKGRPVGNLEEIPAIREGSGTTIRFKPDSEVFINIKNKALPAEYYINLLRRQAMLHNGLSFLFYHEEIGKNIEIKYDNGIADFIDAICEKPMLKKTIMFNGENVGTDDPELYPETYKVRMRFGINFSRKTSLVELHHNGSHLSEGGVTFDALKSAITKAFEDYAKEIGKLNKSDKFNYKDIESIMVAIGDTNAPGNRTFFKNQTKAAINNPFIKYSYGDFIYYNIRKWLSSDKESERVLAEVILNKQAREEAEKVSKKVVKQLSQDARGFGSRPNKFVDCKNKDRLTTELYIVEGDSALGACKLARNEEIQALMPVRGKILNCLKKDLTHILNNDIIRDLLRVLGCGIEAKSEHIEGLPEFDINKLNFGKVIICTDADLDGMQIRCLIITMIYRLMPSLLKAGKVYIAETPLFEITHKKDTYFAYNEPEKETIMSKLIASGINETAIKVQRSKGLGENDPEMMSKSTMHPLTRRLVPIEYPENDSNVLDYFEALLGDDIETRKILINEYFELTDVDID